jgi:hypothetical protein
VSKFDLASSLSAWVRKALTHGREHCVDIRRRIHIPGAGPVDLVAVRHEADRFAVGLWSVCRGEAGDPAIDAMTRRIHAFEAWYSELRERAELQGFSPTHRLFICGNIVARTVRRSPLVDLLSTRGSSIYLWTWSRSRAKFDVAPFYGRCPGFGSSRTQIRDLLTHLTWEDATAAERIPAEKPVPT